jgi:hypothetical protein
MNELIKKLGAKVKTHEATWGEVAKEVNQAFDSDLSSNAVKKRYYRMMKAEKNPQPVNVNQGEYETLYGDGTVEAQKIVNLSPSEKASPDLVLKKLGYDPFEWELAMMSFSNWQQHTREQETKELYAVKFRIKPRNQQLNPEEMLKIVDKVFSEKIKPINLPKKEIDKELDKDSVTVLGAVELHLGKEAREFDVGENYNVDIAIERYETIINVLCEEQEYRKSHKLVYGIGNDFINIDTPANTTTKGTFQYGGISSYELFDIGLKLQLQSLLTLREKYNEIEVVLVKGNHANQLEYALFRALQQRFINDDVVSFRDDYKDIQAIELGNTSVFMTHGDSNYKRIIESMSKEFYKIYGNTEYRYILLGHLHHKQKIDELNGFTVFRLSSPSGIDRWHYKERFVSQAGQEIFTFSKETGLTDVKYITFQKVLKK